MDATSKAAETQRKGAQLAGWGRLPHPGREVMPEELARAPLSAALSRGLGRSYGDSSLPAGASRLAINTTRADRLLSFDEATGLLRAEAGVSLLTLNEVLLPRGWFTPVSPGTQFVTLGGMVAADVHGKNHHVAGCFGEHVRALTLRLASGEVVECGPEQQAELFWATVGGMGLTGHILEVTVQMEAVASPWIYQESERVPNLEVFLDTLERDAGRFPYTVGWIDCVTRGRGMGRGIMIAGRWAQPSEAPQRAPRFHVGLRFPFELPAWTLNRLSIWAFNQLYYWKHWRKVLKQIVSPQTFFYPLDAVREWNKMYGRKGFTQYQCVLPKSSGLAGTRRLLQLLTRQGSASFLCVIKDCGAEGRGVLSFPHPGISIALDIPVRANTQSCIDALNELVLEEGGRIYLAKDAFSRPEHFQAMEPRLEAFRRVQATWDPEGKLESVQALRLGLTDAAVNRGKRAAASQV